MWLIKILIFICYSLGLINTFIKSDFINILVPTFILVIFYTTFHKDQLRNLNLFLIFIGVALGYDLLWFCFSASVFLKIMLLGLCEWNRS